MKLRKKNLLRQAFLIASLTLVLTFQASASPRANRDFNGDGKEDLALWNPATGVYSIVYENGAAKSLQCGLPGDIPLSARPFADQKALPTVWRPRPYPNAALFYICNGSSISEVPLGSAGDIPIASEDFDGDGLTDFTVWRPTTAQWFKSLSSLNGLLVDFVFGEQGDIPVPGDYDGSGASEEAIYRPHTGQWYAIGADRRTLLIKQWGLPSDIPVPGDYDGDGRADFAIWRPVSGQWMVAYNRKKKGYRIVSLGLPGDIPIPRDLDGDGRTDFIVFRPTTGEIFTQLAKKSALRTTAVNAQFSRTSGVARILKPLNDFDGDGRSDYAVVRKLNGALNWYIADSLGQPLPPISWGLDGDTPLARDFDGDGRADFAVLRNVSGTIQWFVLPSNGSDQLTFSFGLGQDQIYTADYDPDGKADLVAVRSGPTGDLYWFIRSSMTLGTTQIPWGREGDTVAQGDYDGDGAEDITVVRGINGMLFWFSRTLSGEQLPGVQWGFVGDTIVPGDFTGDGRTDYGVVRNFSGQLSLLVRSATGEKLAPIPWGLEGDQVVPAHYLGGPQLQAAVWRPGDISSFFINYFPAPSTTFNWGVADDLLVTSHTPVIAPGLAPAVTPGAPVSVGSDASCDDYISNNDGSGGYVHKPVSESNGNLVVLLNSRYNGAATQLELIAEDQVIETTNYVGPTNGNRPTFRARKPGRSYPANLIERFTASGKRICIRIPEPGNRYD